MPIPEPVLEALSRTDLASTQRRVLDVVMLATYGQGAQSAKLQAPGISEVCGVNTGSVSRAMRALVDRGIVIQFINPAGRRFGIFRVNEDVASWRGKGDQLPELVGEKSMLLDDDEQVAQNGTPFRKQDMGHLTECWFDMFFAATGQVYPFSGKDGALLKRLLKIYGLDHCKILIYAFKQEWDEADEWLSSQGLTTTIFNTYVPKMISKAVLKKTQQDVVEERMQRWAEARFKARRGF